MRTTSSFAALILLSLLGSTIPYPSMGEPAPRPEFAETYEEIWLGSGDPEQHYWAATIMVACGEPDRALRLLRSAVEHRYCSYPLLDRDPMFEPVRSRTEFAEILDAGRECQQRFLEHRESGPS